jgi:cytochrome b subunit of formate dehydrogenase
MALTHRDSLRSILKGWVGEGWAAVHASGWLKEQQLTEDSATFESRE